jgi:VanZ family protein
MRRLLLPLLPAAAVMAGIWILSDQPALDILPPLFAGQDKLLHAVEFMVLGAMLAFAGRSPLLSGTVSRAVAGVLWAGLDEIHQSWVPGRDCSTGDFLADCAGLAAGLLLASGFASGAGRGTGA